MKMPRPCINRQAASPRAIDIGCTRGIEYREGVQQVACGLRALGIRKGDIVALHAEPSANFYIADLGIISNGSIAAALYTSLPPGDHARTLAVSEPKALDRGGSEDDASAQRRRCPGSALDSA